MAAESGAHIQPFDTNADNVAARWTAWVTKLNRWLFCKQENMSDVKKLNWLLLLGGDSLVQKYEEVQEEGDTFTAVVEKLTTIFNPPVKYQLNRYNFGQLHQFDDKFF
jgi:hypothetical protein